MELDDDDVIMGVCPTPIAPVPTSVPDISMSDPPAPAVPSLFSLWGSAAAPVLIASASMKQTRKSGPRTFLPFALIASAPAERPQVSQTVQAALPPPLALSFVLPAAPEPSHKLRPRHSLPFELVASSNISSTPPAPAEPSHKGGPLQTLPFALVPSTATMAPQLEHASTVHIFRDCHLPLPDLSTPYNTVLVEASAPGILYIQLPLLASASSLSWSGNTLLASSWTPRPKAEPLFENVLPPLDPQIKCERKEAEDKAIKEKKARKVERLNRAYASIICKRKRDIDEEEVWIRRKTMTRPTKKLRTVVLEVMETAKSVVAGVAVVVLGAVAVIGSVSRAIFGCRHEVQMDRNQEEDFKPSMPGAFPDDRK
ncbi:hypothetical protein DXG01_001488 [Tephrocybe rancida]|nr:hypothetical protein DXG01_001488 [Tephrocybe rancida]